MTDAEFKAMEADRNAGTPGPWRSQHGAGPTNLDEDNRRADTGVWSEVELEAAEASDLEDGDDPMDAAWICGIWGGPLCEKNFADARRIARLPDLEAEVIALRANAKTDAWFASAYQEWCRANGCPPSSKDLIEAMDRLALEGKR